MPEPMSESTPAPKAANPIFNATPVRDFEGQFVCFEAAAAFREGPYTTFTDGEITLSRETVPNLMHSLGKSLGEREKTEEFLATAFDWQG